MDHIRIYIPICLYFNPSSQRRFHFRNMIYIPICLYFNPSSPSPPIFYLFRPLSVDRITIIIILPYFSYLFYKITVKPPLFRSFLLLSIYRDFYLIRGRQLYRAYYCSGSGNNNFLSTSIDIFIFYCIP